MRPPRRSTARAGETLAALWLRLKGYRILSRNWRCAAGELDLVCARGGTLVFVEVKTRLDASAGIPEAAVDRRKQERLVLLARAYLAARRIDGAPCRFDVVAVGNRWPPLRHLKGAFVAAPAV